MLLPPPPWKRTRVLRCRGERWVIGFESYIQRIWVQFENWNPLNSPHPFPYRSFYQPLSFLQPKQLAELDIPPGCLIPNQPMVAGAHWQGWETGPQQGTILWVGMALPVFLWWQIKTIKDTGVVIHTKKGDGFAYLEGWYFLLIFRGMFFLLWW